MLKMLEEYSLLFGILVSVAAVVIFNLIRNYILSHESDEKRLKRLNREWDNRR